MPAPDLKPQVPGAAADTTTEAPAGPIYVADAPNDERQAMVLTLSKQTVAVIAEVLPSLLASDLIALRDLETVGSNRKGALEAIEAEDARRAALADEAADAAADAEDNAAAILVPDYVTAEDANRLYGDDYGVDWVYEGGAYVPPAATAATPAAAASTAKPVAAGQAVLTDAGWVVPEPQAQPKG